MARDGAAGSRRVTRRTLLLGSSALTVAGTATAVAATSAPWPVRRALGLTPDAFIPDAPEGQVHLEAVRSDAMGGDLDLFTAVPAGYGDGAGLPVVVVLHGSSASAADFRRFGLGRFVTAAVRAGAPPFVLAGTDDGPAGWTATGSVDPVGMLRDELPVWLAARGYAADRRALWGWSRGGYGAIRVTLTMPQWARGLALFSPAVDADDPALSDLGALETLPVAVWCGTDDPFYDDVREVVDRLPHPAEVASYSAGAHTRGFWNDHTLAAFSWLAATL